MQHCDRSRITIARCRLLVILVAELGHSGRRPYLPAIYLAGAAASAHPNAGAFLEVNTANHLAYKELFLKVAMLLVCQPI